MHRQDEGMNKTLGTDRMKASTGLKQRTGRRHWQDVIIRRGGLPTARCTSHYCKAFTQTPRLSLLALKGMTRTLQQANWIRGEAQDQGLAASWLNSFHWFIAGSSLTCPLRFSTTRQGQERALETHQDSLTHPATILLYLCLTNEHSLATFTMIYFISKVSFTSFIQPNFHLPIGLYQLTSASITKFPNLTSSILPLCPNYLRTRASTLPSNFLTVLVLILIGTVIIDPIPPRHSSQIFPLKNMPPSLLFCFCPPWFRPVNHSCDITLSILL